MEQRIKQRLIGAAVLVSLAVIFIPIILEGPEDEFGPWGTKMPKRPAQDVMTDLRPLALPKRGASEPVKSIVLDDNNSKSKPDTRDIKSTAGKSPPAGKPKSALDKGLQSWVVQVASFNHEKNAMALRKRLRDKGYTTFVEKLKTKQGNVYRVRVGPELKRSDVEILRDRIATEVKLEGVVTRHP